MRQLNFDLKTLQARHRDGAFVTRRDRAYTLAQAANLLHALGFRRLRATGLRIPFSGAAGGEGGRMGARRWATTSGRSSQQPPWRGRQRAGSCSRRSRANQRDDP